MSTKDLTNRNMPSHAISRRDLGVAALSFAGAFVGGSAAAQGLDRQAADPRPPIVDTSNLQEMAPGVWVVRDHRTWLVPNIGIILGKDAALIVDTGLGPVNGERVLDLARRLAGGRRLLLTLTHFHPEHGYGAQVFRADATILYNRAQRDELEEKGARYVDLFTRTQGQATADLLRGTRITLPHFTYDGPRAEVDLGGRKVELHTWGTAHTRGDQIVFLPKERILFAGDLIEERCFPIFPWFPPADVEIDDTRWLQNLNTFESLNPTVIVPGHGDPGDIRIARNVASHIRAVGGEVRRRRQAGRTAEQIIAEYKPEVVAAYPGWEHPQLIDWEIGYFASRPV